LPGLEEGIHALKIKAWDAMNNSNEVSITCRVIKNRSFSIYRLFNFPNPFSNRTTFRFEHDPDLQDVEVEISIFNTSGQLLKSIKRTINTGGNRSSDIEWDSKSGPGTHILSGTYIYRLRVTSNNGSMAERAGKMVVQ
jgi:hypothetical protein